MHTEDEVKALADSYKGLLVKIQYHNDEGIISVTGVLTEESREALARVKALEFCEDYCIGKRPQTMEEELAELIARWDARLDGICGACDQGSLDAAKDYAKYGPLYLKLIDIQKELEEPK